MAASFPRNWQYSVFHPGDGAVPTITIPAIPGMVHCLTAVDAELVQVGSTNTYTPILLATASGIATYYFEQQLILLATFGDTAAASLTPAVSTAPGASLIVSLNAAAPAGVYATLTIQGYDY